MGCISSKHKPNIKPTVNLSSPPSSTNAPCKSPHAIDERGFSRPDSASNVVEDSREYKNSPAVIRL